jgi:hypothetical protein
MKLSTSIFRREKRDGRNPSSSAKTLEEIKKEADKKRKKIKSISPGD